MGYIAPEIVEEIKKMDLITYLKNYEPDELVRDSRTQYSMKSHSSLKMSNGYWNYFNGGIGGKNAVDYVEKMLGYKFPDSIEYIIKKMNGRVPVYVPQPEKKHDITLILPEKNSNENRVKQYLKSRGIDEEIIQKCIDKKLIYEEKHYHNVVFVGYDEEHDIVTLVIAMGEKKPETEKDLKLAITKLIKLDFLAKLYSVIGKNIANNTLSSFAE